MPRAFIDIPYPTYTESYKAFMRGAKRCKAKIVEYPLLYDRVVQGLNGEKLCVATASTGQQDAENIIFIDVCVHGGEELGGLISLIALFKHLASNPLPQNLRVVCIYPTNPFGASWKRRVNANNVDLSRNFRVFPIHPDELLCHPDYERMYNVLNPTDISRVARLEQQFLMAGYIAEQTGNKLRECLENRDVEKFFSGYSFQRGWSKIKRVVAQGQYKFPKGMYFGGFEAQPENLIIRRIIQNEVPPFVKKLVWINDHIGLGPDDKTTIITEFERDTFKFEKCRVWYGEKQIIESAHDAYGVATTVSGKGCIEYAINEEVCVIAPHCDILDFCLEVGVPASEFELGLLIQQDNWLHNQGDPRSRYGSKIRKKMMDNFYPQDRGWRKQCRKVKMEIYLKTIHAITES